MPYLYGVWTSRSTFRIMRAETIFGSPICKTRAGTGPGKSPPRAAEKAGIANAPTAIPMVPAMVSPITAEMAVKEEP